MLYYITLNIFKQIQTYYHTLAMSSSPPSPSPSLSSAIEYQNEEIPFYHVLTNEEQNAVDKVFARWSAEIYWKDGNNFFSQLYKNNPFGCLPVISKKGELVYVCKSINSDEDKPKFSHDEKEFNQMISNILGSFAEATSQLSPDIAKKLADGFGQVPSFGEGTHKEKFDILKSYCVGFKNILDIEGMQPGIVSIIEKTMDAFNKELCRELNSQFERSYGKNGSSIYPWF